MNNDEFIKMTAFCSGKTVPVSTKLKFRVQPYSEHAYGHLQTYMDNLSGALNALDCLPEEISGLPARLKNTIKKDVLDREVNAYKTLVLEGTLTLPDLLNRVEELGWDATIVAGEHNIITPDTQDSKGFTGYVRLSCNKQLAERMRHNKSGAPYWIGDTRFVR